MVYVCVVNRQRQIANVHKIQSWQNCFSFHNSPSLPPQCTLRHSSAHQAPGNHFSTTTSHSKMSTPEEEHCLDVDPVLLILTWLVAHKTINWSVCVRCVCWWYGVLALCGSQCWVNTTIVVAARYHLTRWRSTVHNILHTHTVQCRWANTNIDREKDSARDTGEYATN